MRGERSQVSNRDFEQLEVCFVLRRFFLPLLFGFIGSTGSAGSSSKKNHFSTFIHTLLLNEPQHLLLRSPDMIGSDI